MKKRTKIIISILSIILFLGISIFTCIYFLFLHHYKGKYVEYNWTEADEFDISSIKTVEKTAGEDFVILNLADVQMCDLDDLFHMSKIKKEIKYLIDQAHPDLITLTGDQTWSNENLISLKSLVRWLDSFKIPYAPVFGNHDYGNEKNSAVLSQNACCDVYEAGKYSLFSRGPTNLGALGNYVVNIVENGQVYKTLYMLDAGYEDMITDMQLSWVEWCANGIKANNGGTYSSGMCFMHKPIPEYRTAYYKYLNNEIEAIGDVYVTYSLSGTSQNGFFDLAQSINIQDIVCGHQHGNCFTLKYEGVRLTFALKTDELGGFYSDDEIYLNGATSFRLNDDVSIENIFVEKNMFK